MSNIKRFIHLYSKSLLSLVLLLTFALSIFTINWGEEIMHSGGKSTLIQITKAIFSPDLSSEIINLSLISAWRTLVYAVGGISIAIILAFIFGVLASGILFKNRGVEKIFRRILGFMRAIHELIWAWLFVAALGLSPFSAIFALAIPYGGTLGRIFADMLKDVPNKPIEALKSSGASKVQVLFYGYLPMVKLDMISYTMYRFECAIRSSAIMSFIGLGGLGYQIQLSLADLEYNEVWTFIFFLVALVVLIDIWSNRLRNQLMKNNKTKRLLKLDFIKFSYTLLFLLVTLSWIFIFRVEGADIFSFFSRKNYIYAKKFLSELIGVGNDNVAFLDMSSWQNALKLTFQTLKMSILAIGFSAIAMIITVIPAARNIADGSLGTKGKWYNWFLFSIVRFLYIFSRAVPEIIWAMIVIFIFKPGILPGAVALALHNFGILGKLSAEVIEDINLRPIRNLSTAGGNSIQQLFYGIIPAVMKKFITYIIYRWEVILRTTIIVGFVGAGGLGLQFKLSMSYFHYTEITLLLICYILLVWFADIVSDKMREIVK